MAESTKGPLDPDRPIHSPFRIRLDEWGRMIPRTEAEEAAATASTLAGLASLAEIPDDPPGSDEAFFRAMDESRPDRPLFRGLY